MAVKVFFGLPGCGKTTLFTKFALNAVRSRKYANVYGNVPLKIFGYTYVDNDCIGKYCLEHGLVLIDEATLYADSRDFKNFKKEQLTYFLEHRHFNVDIILFTQQWDGLDRKIRVITDRCYYVYKPFILGKWFTKYYRIPYGIIIPDPKKDQQKLGEIVQGYCKPNFFIRLFAPVLFRPKYYKYFDSWIRPEGFNPLPSKYHAYVEADPFSGELLTTSKQARRASLHSRSVRIRSFFADLPHLIKSLPQKFRVLPSRFCTGFLSFCMKIKMIRFRKKW